MSARTVTNQKYSGLLEKVRIPADLEERSDKKVARFGSVLPIHCATPEQVEELAPKTHHYCDIFTEDLLAPLGELALVRIDEDTAEKVFVNRNKRLLLVSSSLVSSLFYVAGTPVCTQSGALASVLTAHRAHGYAVSNFEGDGGYFETTEPWQMLDLEDGKMVYGDKCFDSRKESRQYVRSLPAAEVGHGAAPRPVLWRGRKPRLALVAANGRQLSHQYVTGVHSDSVEYL